MADFSIFSPDGGTTALNVKDAKARDIVSDAFDSETSYDIGDYCIYEGALYKCSIAHTGAWNASDFSVTTIAEELKNSGGGGDLSAYQTKNLATPLSISGISQSTVETALGAISKKTSLLADINRNLGTVITTTQKLAIANGTFEDLPIGAYWTLNGTAYRIAHHDYYLGTGNTECTSHHIVVVPDNNMYNAVMNDTNTTTGGYANSKMRTTNLATALSTFETDFGVAHILNHRILVTNAVSDGQASGWAWFGSKVDLMSENMVFGHPVWGRAGHETGVERGQLALFSLYPEYIQKQRLWYWLRSVCSGSAFCDVDPIGSAGRADASFSVGVRPYTCIYFDDVLT